MEKLQKYSVLVAVLLFFAIMNLTFYSIYQHREKKRFKNEISELKEKVIVLQDSLNVTEIKMNRYEITLEHMKDIDTSCAKEFQTYMNDYVE